MEPIDESKQAGQLLPNTDQDPDSTDSVPAQAAASPVDEGEYQTTTAEAESRSSPPRSSTVTDTPGKDQSVASFTLEFLVKETNDGYIQQVVAEHLEDRQQKVTASFHDDDIYTWILDKVAESLNKFSPQMVIQENAIALEIIEINFLQPSISSVATLSKAQITDKAAVLLTEILNSRYPVVVEVTFQLVGLGITALTREKPAYQIQGKFHNRADGTHIPIESSPAGNLATGQRTYKVRLPETKLSSGTYRFDLAVAIPQLPLPPAISEVSVTLLPL